ncbi:hypothetical protein CCR75_003839 [Bremia lactucae]|uniref:Uncharacterized protein n=1 Tax=Bremia lactucae TaxID=4779 RepID=A0A976IKY8_BRELC|nr:hypothetical protein CCR75_003839 [Bremia lactucae]
MKLIICSAIVLAVSALSGQNERVCEPTPVYLDPYYVIDEKHTEKSMCTTTKFLTNSIAWNTTFTVANDDLSVVKSYVRAQLVLKDLQIASIQSIPATISHAYTGESFVSTVVLDMYIGTKSDTTTMSQVTSMTKETSMIHLPSPSIRILVVLATYGNGSLTWLVTKLLTVQIGNDKFDLYEGYLDGFTVYTFVIYTGTKAFNGDLIEFIKRLPQGKTIDESQYLFSVQGGSQIFCGTNAMYEATEFMVDYKVKTLAM